MKNNYIFIGFVLFFVGIFLIILKGLLGDTIDQTGMLQENFFLIPIGYLCIFIGLIIIIVFKLIHKSN